MTEFIIKPIFPNIHNKLFFTMCKIFDIDYRKYIDYSDGVRIIEVNFTGNFLSRVLNENL